MSTVIHSSMTKNDYGIEYTVSVDGRRIWRTFVRFGKTKAARAGGSDFVLAAREQDRVASEALGKTWRQP